MDDQIIVATDYSVNVFTLAKKTLVVKLAPKTNKIIVEGVIVNQNVYDKFKKKVGEAVDERDKKSKAEPELS